MTSALWLTLCLVAWVAVVYVLARFISIGKDEVSDDQRIDTIRDELDSQEMRTRRVRGLS